MKESWDANEKRDKLKKMKLADLGTLGPRDSVSIYKKEIGIEVPEIFVCPGQKILDTSVVNEPLVKRSGGILIEKLLGSIEWSGVGKKANAGKTTGAAGGSKGVEDGNSQKDADDGRRNKGFERDGSGAKLQKQKIEK